MASSPRLHYFDHLRALAMLAGVLFHAALAYSPLMQPLFPTADRETSAWIDAPLWLLHLFRMPLFFAVSGFFAALLVERLGGAATARQRVRRIALPFLIAWPIVIWALDASTAWAMRHVEHPSALLIFLRDWEAREDAPPLPPGTAHLWFLYYLIWFGLLHWIARTLGAKLAWSAQLFRSRPGLLLVLPLLICPALASVSTPHPAPEGLLPQFWALGYYGAFYLLGMHLHDEPGLLDRLRPLLAPLLIASALGYALFYWQLPAAINPLQPETASWPMALLQAVLSVWLTLCCLLLGKALLDRPNTWLRPLSRSAYWTYLIHLPLLFAIQYPLMNLDAPWWAKFGFASCATLALCFLSYRWLVQPTRMARFVG
ncbi:acyltransferase family protein [Pseudomarimonas salicorniae]|uniref:Acyltransferase family protein n=1 Tax=Pseudomarimonas salicorniae TaxID=2933270 RepID=A0ABT0GLP9_9GAMM|nr:acyltransferase family protein [Lysobacter sp. CAU 1642]MCK7595348.1 acyltransferase family protein [Lysobacter sp. CAU 1642]